MKYLAFLLIFLTSFAYAQSPQSQNAPNYAVNAKYVNGVAPGYAPTAGKALILNLSSGTAICTSIQQYTGGVLVMTANATNYVYLDTSNNCTPMVSTTPFVTATQIPLATVTTTSVITSIVDMRTPFTIGQGASGSGTVTNQANGIVPLATAPTVIGAQSHLDDGVTTANTITASRVFAAPAVNGFNSAKQLQTGGGNNGIANCFATQTYCLAGPDYANTEHPFSFSGTVVPGPTNAFFQDYRQGEIGNLYHNPGTSPWLTSYRLPYSQVMVNDTTQNPPTGSGNITAPVFPFSQWLTFSAPGLDIGNAAFGPTGWHTQEAHVINMAVNSPGISAGLSCGLTKSGAGDNFCIGGSTTSYGGSKAPSDEGSKLLRLLGGTASQQYVGTVNTGSTGATSITVNCTSDCANPGDERYLMLSTPVASGQVLTNTSPSGSTPGFFTTDQSNTPSTAWGTLSGNCAPAISAPVGLTGTSITCNVAMLSGTFSAGDLVCFAGQYHEQAKLTAATGTTITAPLRHQHGSGTWAMAGPPCGTFINFPANDSTPIGQNLQYPIDIIGSTASGTLQFAFFDSGSSNAGFNAGTGEFNTNTFAATALTNVGGIVTMVAGSASILSHPELYSNVTITINNAADSAYNGTCTNSFHTPNGASNSLSCTQSASNGHSTSATGTIEFNTSSYIQLQGAETLDVQTYTSGAAAVVSPGNVTTFALEPNNAAWTASAPVIQPAHYALHGLAAQANWLDNNPYANRTSGLSWGYNGKRISGGNPASVSTYAVERFANGTPTNTYSYHGGSVTPPGGIVWTGLHNYYLATQFAPDPIGASAFYFGCPLSGCTDKDFNYAVVTATGSGGNGVLTYRPAFNEFSWSSGNLILPTNLGGQTFNGNLIGQALATPVAPTTSTSVTGGTINDAVQHCYVIVAHGTNGDSPAGPEHCQTTGSSGSNTNSIQVDWSRQTGSIQYKLCEGATGGPYNVLVTTSGVDSTRALDTGQAVGAACSTTNTSQPSLETWASVGLINQSSGFTARLVPTTLTANRTLTLPDATGTVALTSQIPSVPVKITNSITPSAATASQCVEQTFNTYTGLVTTQQVGVSPPAGLGIHLWIGWTRVSASNTLAIGFCGDATAGTPPSGNYIAVAF